MGRAAHVHLDSWAGRSRVPVQVVGETAKRYRVVWQQSALRWREGQVSLVPKEAVTFDDAPAGEKPATVAALERVERLIESQVFALTVPLEGVDAPTVDEWQAALDEVRAALGREGN